MNRIRLEYKFTAIYLILGFLWISFSDRFLNSLIADPDYLTRIQTYKGWFYVSITALLFYFYLRKHLVKQRNAEKKAIESDRLKTAFLQNISHEIRTPMNGIIGFTSLLHDDGLEDDLKKQYLKIITSSSNRLLDVVNEMLDISLIETGNLRINTHELDVNRMMDESFGSFLPQLNPKVTLSCSKGLDNNQSIIVTDGVKVRQVLNNLLSNAVKFTEKGEIRFGNSLNNNHLDFFVEDTGIGIPKEYHDNIFDRFRKAEIELTKFYDGVGLGLSICKGNLELLNGNISVESEFGKGSVFSFSIPYVRAEEKAGTTTGDPEQSPLKATPGLVILVAEDEMTNFRYIKELLEGTDIEILHAANGLSAVELCESRHDIDLVLMDIKMPVMDGYEAKLKIHIQRPGLPVVAQTAYAMPDEREKAMKAGFAGYISKPFKKDQLLGIISKYV